MGGKNVYNDYKDCIQKRHCNEMKGGMYAVDLTFQQYRIMIGIKNKKRNKDKQIHDYIDINLIDPEGSKTLDELIEYEDSVAHLIAICSFTEATIDKSLFTILVLDGKAPDLKRKKLEERKKNRVRANEEKSKIEDKTSDDYIRHHKRSVELRNTHYQEISDLIKAMGLIEVQSPGEADSQCAAIATCLPNVDGVICEDSDVLLFGGTKVIKNFSRKNSMINEIKLCDILESLKIKANQILRDNNLSEINEFDKESFIDNRILLGTDYNDPIIGIESEKMFELFVLNNFSVPNLISKLEAMKNEENMSIIIPENFEERWKEVKKYYLEADVIDPMTIEISLKAPNLAKMIEILHKKNNFNIKFVKKLYNGLVHMYKLFYNIPFGSDWYNSFRSYQVKFHSNKLQNQKNKNLKQYKKSYINHQNRNFLINPPTKYSKENIIVNPSKSNKYEILAY